MPSLASKYQCDNNGCETILLKEKFWILRFNIDDNNEVIIYRPRADFNFYSNTDIAICGEACLLKSINRFIECSIQKN